MYIYLDIFGLCDSPTILLLYVSRSPNIEKMDVYMANVFYYDYHVYKGMQYNHLSLPISIHEYKFSPMPSSR